VRDPRRGRPPEHTPALGNPVTAFDEGWDITTGELRRNTLQGLGASVTIRDDEAIPQRLPTIEPSAAVQYGFDDDPDAVPPAPLKLLEGPPPEPADPDGDELFASLEEAAQKGGTLVNLVGVKFRAAGKIYDYDAGDLTLAPGQRVVVDSENGLTLGEVAVVPARRMVHSPPGRRVVRVADPNDERQQARNHSREEDALGFARERVRERRLNMKLFRVEYLHGGHKALFYFTSEARIDFRELVKDLAHRLHTRIEMRQVGVRDEAKIVGGIGDCGRELCCSTWLPQFAPVSIRMAKDQGIVLNPTRVSGQCGRLKCCLVYEEAQYREARKGLPKVGKRVISPDGEGRVQELDVLGGRIRVSLPGGGSKMFPAQEIEIAAPMPNEPRRNDPDGGPDHDGDKPPPGVPTE
jgi:cell fate regulator YaaT (PSP1 superfamily)